MTNLSAQNPMTYLKHLTPILQACGDGSKQYDENGKLTTTSASCSCTDPSYEYNNPCKLQSANNNSGRFHCTFRPTGTEGVNPSTGGSLKNVNDLEYKITPKGGDPTTFSTQQNAQMFTGTSKYPSSLLFCANPQRGGNAKPNLPTNNITVSPSGGFTNWTASNPNKSNTNRVSNIGFD